MLNIFALKRNGKFIGVTDVLKQIGDDYYASLKMINEENGFVEDIDGFISRFLGMHNGIKIMLESLAETFLSEFGVSHAIEYPEDEITTLERFVEDKEKPAMVAKKGFDDDMEDKEMAVKKELVYEWVLNKNGSPIKAQRICKGTYLDPKKNVRFKADNVFASREKAREAARKIKKVTFFRFV